MTPTSLRKSTLISDGEESDIVNTRYEDDTSVKSDIVDNLLKADEWVVWDNHIISAIGLKPPCSPQIDPAGSFAMGCMPACRETLRSRYGPLRPLSNRYENCLDGNTG